MKKLKLDDIKVESFATELNSKEKETVNGGWTWIPAGFVVGAVAAASPRLGDAWNALRGVRDNNELDEAQDVLDRADERSRRRRELGHNNNNYGYAPTYGGNYDQAWA